MILPPPVGNKTNNSKWSKSEVENSGIQALGRFFTQLLGGFSTNGTLGGGIGSD